METNLASAVFKNITKTVEEIGTLGQMLEVLQKYDVYLVDKNVRELFFTKLDQLEVQNISNIDKEIIEDIRDDLELSSEIYFRDESFDSKDLLLTLTISTKATTVREDFLRVMFIFACDRFNGQEEMIAWFLGMSKEELKIYLRDNKGIKSYLTKKRQKILRYNDIEEESDEA